MDGVAIGSFAADLPSRGGSQLAGVIASSSRRQDSSLVDDSLGSNGCRTGAKLQEANAAELVNLCGPSKTGVSYPARSSEK